MGQKANPIGNRLGIIRGWDSNWYADKDYGLKVVEDEKIRNYLRARRPKTATADPRERNKPMQNGISRIVIERTLRRVTVTIHTSRPGIIIGKGGKEVDLIKEELKVLTGKEVQINIFEIRKPELDANIVGEQIAKQIEAHGLKKGEFILTEEALRAAASQANMAAIVVAAGASRRMGFDKLMAPLLGRPLIAHSLAAFAACAAPGDEDVNSSEDSISEASWEPVSRALGNPPNFAQLGNGSTMSVVFAGAGCTRPPERGQRTLRGARATAPGSDRVPR